MKKFALFVLMLCLAAAALPRTVMADDEWLGYFYEELNPYGEWVYVAGYGDCWRPYDTGPAWAPYTDGYWAYTDAGWTWVSYEDFGPITYHYGRWFRVDGLGWLWRPGTEWGPAWVSWRSSDDYIGWAPLPPEVVFDTGIGISVWVDRDYDIGPGYYSFCHAYDFGAPVMSGVIFNRSRNVTIINQTVNITNITINRSRKIVYNGGPDYRRVSRHSRHHIATLRLDRRHDDRDNHRRGGRRSIERSRRDGDRLVIHAPDSKWIREQRTSRPKVSRRVERPTVDKGWASVRDQEDRQRIRRKFQTETKGVTRTSAPARPVDEKTFEAALEADKARRERNANRRDSGRRNTAIEEEHRERRTEAGRSPEANRPPTASENGSARRTRQDAAGREGRTRDDAARDRQRETSEERSRSSAGRPAREQDRTREQQDAARQQQQRGQQERAREQQENARRQQDAARQQQQRGQQDRAREQQESTRRQQEAARQQQQRGQQERAREQQESARRQQDAARQQQQRQQQERARQQQESARRQQEAARQQQQRQQQERARQQQESARRQQEAARQQQQRQQQERARQQQESARRQQEAARQQQQRQQQDRARQQQESARRQQEAARQQQQRQQRDSDRQRDGRSTSAGRDSR